MYDSYETVILSIYLTLENFYLLLFNIKLKRITVIISHRREQFNSKSSFNI